MIKTSLRM